MSKHFLYINSSTFQLNEEYVATNFLEKLANLQFDYHIDLPSKLNDYKENNYWLKPVGTYCLYFGKELFEIRDYREVLKNTIDSFIAFLDPIFLSIIIKVNELMKEDRKGIRPLTEISIFLEFYDTLIISFIFDDIISEDNLKDQLNALFEVVDEIHNKSNGLFEEISKTFKVDNRTVFFLFNQNDNKWELLDLLYQLGKEKMLEIGPDYDRRISKPDMMVNENNLSQQFTLPQNWRITNKSRGFIMHIPNDIALYSSIANKAIERAKERFTEMSKHGITELIMSNEESSRFFDYFEEIIQGIVMSYTTIECMANKCIPSRFEYVIEKPGKKEVFDKEGIERYFSLKDKLKKILPEALGVESPVKETWWQNLIDLENSRNEIIHTKDVKSEDRYSFFVKDNIFEIVTCHNEIIKFYGSQLVSIKSHSINEFPVGFGCDEIIPAIMSQKTYNSMYNSFFNPRTPLEE